MVKLRVTQVVEVGHWLPRTMSVLFSGVEAAG